MNKRPDVLRILAIVAGLAALVTGYLLGELGILDTTGALVLTLVSMIGALIAYPFTGWKL